MEGLQSPRANRSKKLRTSGRVRVAILAAISLFCCFLVVLNSSTLSSPSTPVSDLLTLLGDLSTREGASALRAALHAEGHHSEGGRHSPEYATSYEMLFSAHDPLHA